jgi:hypothetical protein
MRNSLILAIIVLLLAGCATDEQALPTRFIPPTATAIPTETPAPTATASPTATPVIFLTLYTERALYARACASISCDNLGLIDRGEALSVTGMEEGEAVNGNVNWIQFIHNDTLAYLPADDLCDGKPTPYPTLGSPHPGLPIYAPGPGSQQARPTQPGQPAQAASGCDCNSGDTLNCSNFSTHNQAQACFVKCMNEVGYDVHNLDGNRGQPGVACESLP